MLVNSVTLYLIEILHQTTTQSRFIRIGYRLYLIEILHQTTTKWRAGGTARSCILSKFYIKPQLCCHWSYCYCVVSYRNSTSNHNISIFRGVSIIVVSYRNSTSNHNREDIKVNQRVVVSYRNSTSNHNTLLCIPGNHELYLIEILHQTTTELLIRLRTPKLYLIEILHQTTTWRGIPPSVISLYLIEILHQTTTLSIIAMMFTLLYLIEILHQTTTHFLLRHRRFRCILSKFYIKPQPETW